MSHRSRVQTPQGTCFVLLSAGSWSCSRFLGVFGGYGLAVYPVVCLLSSGHDLVEGGRPTRGRMQEAGAYFKAPVCCRWACCVGGITRETQPTGASSHPFEQSTKLVFIPGAHSGEDRREAMKRNLRQVWLRTQVMRFGLLITSPLGLMDKASDF